MNQTALNPEHQMMQYILGKWISKPIYVAAKLGIADILSVKDTQINDLAKHTGTSSSGLYRMMRALAGVGIFKEIKDKMFSNTPLSECLKVNRLKPAALFFESAWHNRLWDELLYSVENEKTASDKVFGKPIFEWLVDNPEEGEIFHRANAMKASSSHRVIVEVYDFHGINSLMDVGGGYGNLMIEILKVYPHINGIIAELPNMIPNICQSIKTSQLESQMKAVECDFLETIPKGCDVYLMSHILHDWPDEACITILKNCRKVIPENGKLLIIESIIPSGNEFSIAKLLDLEVLLMGGGKERTVEEFNNLFQNSGFKLSNIVPTEESISIIEGVPL